MSSEMTYLVGKQHGRESYARARGLMKKMRIKKIRYSKMFLKIRKE